jgi:hypothetical protein
MEHTHPQIVQDKEASCRCHGSYFYARIPCNQAPHNVSSTTTMGFSDAQYLKTNTGASAYHIDPDGALVIINPGVYSVDVTSTLTSLQGLSGPAFVSLALYVESYTGYSPFTQQQIPVMVEPISDGDLAAGQMMVHSNAVIHVGDPLYGIGVYPVRAYFVISADGASFSPDLEVTVRS